MGFFNKKHKKNPHIVQDIVDDELVEEDKPKESSPSNLKSSADFLLQGVTVDIEKLKAQAEANNELRQLFSEKFSRIDEEIGEIKTMLVDREKDMQVLEVSATKATDLVSEVQPEMLMGEVRQMDAKFESLKGKIDSHEQVNETIMDELKQVRDTVRTFRGMKEIEKMNKELIDDQVTVKKIEDKIERDSDKVETIFMEINKTYEDFRHFKDMASSINDKFNQTLSEFERFKIKFSSLATKDELADFKSEIVKLTGPMKVAQENFGVFLSEFRYLDKEVKPIIKKFDELEKEKEFFRKGFENFKVALQAKLSEKIKNYEAIIVRLERQVEMLSQEPSGIELQNRTESLEKQNHEIKATLAKLAHLLKNVLDEIKK